MHMVYGAENEWCPIRGFDLYFINGRGNVLDGRRNPPTYLPIELLDGRLAVVRLVATGTFRPHPVSIDSLMVGNLIDQHPDTDTYELVHLDGDPMNCRVDNYGWARKRLPRGGPGPWRRRT